MSERNPPRKTTPGFDPAVRWYAIVAPSLRARLAGVLLGVSSGMSLDDSIPPARPTGRRTAVLQILPALVSGGAERGTIEVAGALVEAGWLAYVASSGGPLERDVARAGGTHLTLPLASK